MASNGPKKAERCPPSKASTRDPVVTPRLLYHGPTPARDCPAGTGRRRLLDRARPHSRRRPDRKTRQAHLDHDRMVGRAFFAIGEQASLVTLAVLMHHLHG